MSDVQKIEELVFEILESADPQGALRRVAAESPHLVDRVRRVMSRVLAEENLIPDEAFAPPPRFDLQAGLPRQFGRFRLLECLGAGGMGAVYRAHDERLRRDVALKQIRPEFIASAAARRRFELEATGASRLDHPALCRVYESGAIEEVPYLIMPLIEGTTLERRIRMAARGEAGVLPGMAPGMPTGLAPDGSPSGMALLLRFFATAADALQHAHDRGLVHRDVKPANIMVTASGDPVVLDFGLLRDDSMQDWSLTSTGALLGTPNYMPPEQLLANRAPLDRTADIYALGISLYQALTLRLPFDATTLLDLQHLIVNQPPPSLRRINLEVPYDLQVVVERAIDKQPHRRYRTAAAMAADLRAIVARQPIAARPNSVALRIHRWCRRNPVAASAGTLLVIGLLIVGTLFGQAERARASARVQLDRFHSLAVVEKLSHAVATADQLYPASPDLVPRIEAWLTDEVEPLLIDIPRVRTTLAALETNADPHAPHEEVAARRFLVQTLRDLEPRLLRFFADDGLVAAVRQRLSVSATIRAVSLDAHQDAWLAAAAAIASADGQSASPAYSGLQIQPQIGLVPLGMDPESRLWEFYDVLSATPGSSLPSRDARGRLQLEESSGLVFVLIPPGDFWMGAQGDDPDAPNFDPDDPIGGGSSMEDDERPVHRVAIDAFLLSKFEMTQAQWQRLMGNNPSRYNPDTDFGKLAVRKPGPTNPVEGLSWNDAAECARRHGYLLPTEAQWEYACRAGTGTRFSWGDDPRLAEHHANAPDASALPFADKGFGTVYPWNDGHLLHAPVGSYAPNQFGLHDMHGNVSELCRDHKLPYTVPAGPGDGLRAPQSGGSMPPYRVLRGGCFQLPMHVHRSADRMHIGSAQISEFHGFRPARRVHR